MQLLLSRIWLFWFVIRWWDVHQFTSPSNILPSPVAQSHNELSTASEYPWNWTYLLLVIDTDIFCRHFSFSISFANKLLCCQYTKFLVLLETNANISLFDSVLCEKSNKINISVAMLIHYSIFSIMLNLDRSCQATRETNSKHLKN